jgi:hypothetical protein
MWKVEIRRTDLRSSRAKSLQDPISTNKKQGMVAHTRHPSSEESVNKDDGGPGLPGINMKPYSKNS